VCAVGLFVVCVPSVFVWCVCELCVRGVLLGVCGVCVF